MPHLPAVKRTSLHYSMQEEAWPPARPASAGPDSSRSRLHLPTLYQPQYTYQPPSMQGLDPFHPTNLRSYVLKKQITIPTSSSPSSTACHPPINARYCEQRFAHADGPGFMEPFISSQNHMCTRASSERPSLGVVEESGATTSGLECILLYALSTCSIPHLYKGTYALVNLFETILLYAELLH